MPKYEPGRSLRPVIDGVWSLARTREAFEHMAEGRHLGKVCIRIGD